MALDTSVFQNIQQPKPVDILGPYKTLQDLKTLQLNQQDIAGQIQERQATAQREQISNQKALGVAKVIHDHVLNGGALDDDALVGKISAIDPTIGLTWQSKQQEIKKAKAETTKAEREGQAAMTAPVEPNQTLFDKLSGKPIYTAPATALQTAQASEAAANTRKANAEAVLKELESGTFPKSIDEAQTRLNAIAPPTDPTFKSTNERFSQLLKAQPFTPALAADTLKAASNEAEKSATAKNTVPFKVEVQNAGAAQATGAGLDLMAEQALNGNFSSRNPVLMSKVYQRAAEMAKERGLSSTGVIMAQNAAKANKEALNTITNQMTQVEAFSQTAERNMKTLEGAMKNVSDLGAPFLNTPIRNLQQKYAGNEKVTGFYAALQPVQTEIAKILNSSNASGVLTDNARNEMQAALGPGATPAQLKAALDVFRKDIQNRREVYQASQKDLVGKTAVGGSAAPPSGNEVIRFQDLPQ